MNKEDMMMLEKKMWEAAKNRNKEEFLDVVSEEAVMVCGGYRCTGKEYADIISVFDCKCYNIVNFEVVHNDSNTIQVHYVITLEVNDEKNIDLAGTFHITTTWKKYENHWKVVFNMAQRIVEHDMQVF
ncbi:MAG: nuclear transport factor 2 family protein [bacterium]|nr:nuclear transport factor 2 family protein [bacterium]